MHDIDYVLYIMIKQLFYTSSNIQYKSYIMLRFKSYIK